MNSTRRRFLKQTLIPTGWLATTGFACRSRPWMGVREGNSLETVLGRMPSSRMGVTLPHEHILVDFIGAAKITRDRYRADEVFETAIPHLRRIRDLGCHTFVECTPAFIGRDAALLARLAKASGLNVLTNTGYYGASQNKYLPQHAFAESPDQLAERWIREAKEGIEGTGIHPGFIKIGVDAGRLSDIHRKLVRAAARAHRTTGLTIAAHTGNGVAALDELSVLHEEGLSGAAFIWVHAQNESNPDLHARAAERGAWVEFDGIGPKSLDQHLKLVRAMRDRGFLNRVLLSHDAGWYHVGEPGGGNFRPFDILFTAFVPALKQNGFTDLEIRQLLVRIRARRSQWESAAAEADWLASGAPKVVGGHDWSEEYGLRRQSAATTALWVARGALRLAEASGQSYAESGVALRLPPQSKKSPTTSGCSARVTQSKAESSRHASALQKCRQAYRGLFHDGAVKSLNCRDRFRMSIHHLRLADRERADSLPRN